jgi:phage gp36-like protein
VNPYITLSDFNLVIQPTLLNQVVGTQSATLDLAVDIAMSEAQSYLIQKYDIIGEYSLTGVTQSRCIELLVRICDIALYHIHSRIAPSNVPELRKVRYDNSIKWLKDCAVGNVTPNLARLDPESGSRIRFVSNPRDISNYN